MNENRSIVCLTMIVRNEAKVIERCLRSVLPYIDRWAIIDTGSTDGTQGIIREYLKHLPGQLQEWDWEDFSTNRNQSLDLAAQECRDCLERAYSLVIDADDEFSYESNRLFSELLAAKLSGFYVTVRYGSYDYDRLALLRLDAGWHYVGPVHEYPTTSPPPKVAILDQTYINVHNDGARSQQDLEQKFMSDAKVLRRELERTDEEYYSRNRDQFYLAQSLRDAGHVVEAISEYKKRVDLLGWLDEIWYSMFQIGALEYHLATITSTVVPLYEKDVTPRYRHENEAILWYRRAIEYNPHRLEPYYWLALLYIHQKEWELALHQLRVARIEDENCKIIKGLFLDISIPYRIRELEYRILLQLGFEYGAETMLKQAISFVPERYKAVKEQLIDEHQELLKHRERSSSYSEYLEKRNAKQEVKGA